MNFFKNLKNFENCEKPLKAIGLMAAAALVINGVKAICVGINTWYNKRVAKKLEDHKAQKAQQTETHKAKEERATKEAQAQAQADAYERMREADAKLYREKMEIDLEKRRRFKEMAEQQSASAGDEPAKGPSEPIDDLLTTEKLFNRRRRRRSWERWIAAVGKDGLFKVISSLDKLRW